MSPRATCVVVGAGISGLSAAWQLSEQPGWRVVVLEGADRVGGKLRGGTLAGVPVDLGAESLLARRPEGLDLIEQVGLSGDLVHPVTSRAAVWSRGALHPLPAGTLMGIPADPGALRGLLTDREIERVLAERPRAGAGDVSVGDLVAERLGSAVLDRLVEPLLGGVYAGHAREISAAAGLPALLAAHREGRSLVALAAAARPDPDRPPAPVFAGLRGGLHRLPERLALRLVERGVSVRTGVTVRDVSRATDGKFTVTTGPDRTTYEVDAVVLAVPPAPAARLLARTAARAASLLSGVQSASMAIITLALPAGTAPALEGSGVLVPPVEGLTIKAATFSATKWDWVRRAGLGAGPAGQDVLVLRASVGRHREEAVLQRADGDLVALVIADLSRVLGGAPPPPLGAHVQRWGGGLPQYAVGHVERVAAVQADVAGVPGLAVCGAAFEGVGVPACIASGRAAAQDVLSARGGAGQPPAPQ